MVTTSDSHSLVGIEKAALARSVVDTEREFALWLAELRSVGQDQHESARSGGVHSHRFLPLTAEMLSWGHAGSWSQVTTISQILRANAQHGLSLIVRQLLHAQLNERMPKLSPYNEPAPKPAARDPSFQRRNAAAAAVTHSSA